MHISHFRSIACLFFYYKKYRAVCSNGGEPFERLECVRTTKLALNAVLDYLFIFYHDVKLAFSDLNNSLPNLYIIMYRSAHCIMSQLINHS